MRLDLNLKAAVDHINCEVLFSGTIYHLLRTDSCSISLTLKPDGATIAMSGRAWAREERRALRVSYIANWLATR